MSIMKFGDKMPSPYLERLKVEDRTTKRFTFLDLSGVIPLQFHYLSYYNHKGSFSCCGGVCCSEFGMVRQSYILPIWEYTGQGWQGSIKALDMSPARYEMVKKLLAKYPGTTMDFTADGQKRGNGVDWTINPCLDGRWINNIPQVEGQKVLDTVKAFWTIAEKSLVKDTTAQEWMGIIRELIQSGEKQPNQGGNTNTTVFQNQGVGSGNVQGFIGQQQQQPFGQQNNQQQFGQQQQPAQNNFGLPNNQSQGQGFFGQQNNQQQQPFGQQPVQKVDPPQMTQPQQFNPQQFGGNNNQVNTQNDTQDLSQDEINAYIDP